MKTSKSKTKSEILTESAIDLFNKAILLMENKNFVEAENCPAPTNWTSLRVSIVS